jgi:hypothetical protein
MSESAIPITTGTGAASVASDLVSNYNYQQIKVVDGTLGSTNAWQVNSDGSAQVSVVGTVIITGSVQGSFTPPANQSVSGTIAANIQGSVATVIIGGSISASFTPPANQSVSGTVGASIIGAVPVTLYTTPGSIVSGVTSVITGTTSVQVLAPASGGQRNYITQILVTNGAAVGTFVNLYDATNVIYSGYAAASGGGFALSFPSPLRQSSIAGNFSALTTTQASVVVSASGYTAP